MSHWINLIQLLIIIITVGLFYRSFIKNTSSEQLVHGLFGLGILWILSFIMNWLNLNLLAGFLHWTSLFLSVGLIVIFQPELRRFLSLLGNIKILRTFFSKSSFKNALEEGETDMAISNILKAVEYMSKKHTGALIVFKDDTDTSTENLGTIIDAKISSELLLTIFFNKTPLHDGALIVHKNRIYSAGAILPLSKNENLNWKYGTRHRAAIGKSESSASIVLVVSEETGDISIAEKGSLKKYDDLKKLKTRLEKIIKGDK